VNNVAFKVGLFQRDGFPDVHASLHSANVAQGSGKIPTSAVICSGVKDVPLYTTLLVGYLRQLDSKGQDFSGSGRYSRPNAKLDDGPTAFCQRVGNCWKVVSVVGTNRCSAVGTLRNRTIAARCACVAVTIHMLDLPGQN